MKALHLLFSGTGGSASVVFSIIEGDKKKFLNNEIIFTGPKICTDYKIKCSQLSTNFSYIKTIKYISFLSYYLILKKIIDYRPKIIFLHNFLIVPTILYKIIFRKKKIIYIIHTPLNKLSWREYTTIRLSVFINKIICLNEETYIFLKNKFKKKSAKFILIPNGINTNYWSSKISKKKNYFKIGMACRVNEHKKYDLIIKSLLLKNINNLNIRFSLAGDGENYNNLKREIKKMNLNNKIKLEGYLKEWELKKWYKTLDLYIQATSGEGMSISLLQAMSMKIPVMGSEVTGIKNFLCKKKYLGFLFKNNTSDLSKGIKYFYYLSNKIRKKFIITQYDYIINNHDSKKIFLKYFSQIKN